MAETSRQFSVVLDLNKCIGCQTCTVACKNLWTNDEGMDYMYWNTVNTMPGKGTPRNWEELGGGFKDGKANPSRIATKKEYGEAWDFNFDEVFYGGKKNAQLLPTNADGSAPDWGPNWDEDEASGTYPNGYNFYLPRLCNHCTHAACEAACPRKAISKRDQDGIVLIDEDKCNGYRFCMEACPYKKIYFNHVTQVSQKCISCFPRVEQMVAPACARQCPGRVRFVGFRDDEDAPIYKLVDKWKVALPLHPEYGTEPNVFYVPPILPPKFNEDGTIDENSPRIPDEYLVSLFGPQVLDSLKVLQGEMDKKRNGEKSELLETLIGFKWLDMFGGFDQDPSTLDRKSRDDSQPASIPMEAVSKVEVFDPAANNKG